MTKSIYIAVCLNVLPMVSTQCFAEEIHKTKLTLPSAPSTTAPRTNWSIGAGAGLSVYYDSMSNSNAIGVSDGWTIAPLGTLSIERLMTHRVYFLFDVDGSFLKTNKNNRQSSTSSTTAGLLGNLTHLLDIQFQWMRV